MKNRNFYGTSSWDKNKLILEYDETKQLICFDIKDYCVK